MYVGAFPCPQSLPDRRTRRRMAAPMELRDDIAEAAAGWGLNPHYVSSPHCQSIESLFTFSYFFDVDVLMIFLSLSLSRFSCGFFMRFN